jgi:uncharacterized RDD family membrane protein YckC
MKTYNGHETSRKSALHGVELATFTRRALAFLADIAIAAALFGIFTTILEPLFIKQGWIKSGDEIVFAFNLNWYSVAWTVLYFGLATYLGNGKTPGKWIVGIRTVSLVHTKMSLWHSVERALGYGASLLEGGFGFFQYFIHPNKRTVHDRIAETIVVRDIREQDEET